MASEYKPVMVAEGVERVTTPQPSNTEGIVEGGLYFWGPADYWDAGISPPKRRKPRVTRKMKEHRAASGVLFRHFEDAGMEGKSAQEIGAAIAEFRAKNPELWKEIGATELRRLEALEKSQKRRERRPAKRINPSTSS